MKSILLLSNCDDLIDLRSEIKEHLAGEEIHPVIVDEPEIMTDGTLEQAFLEKFQDSLKASNLVVIVLSRYYGPILSDRRLGEVSFVHLGYLEALANNKPVLLCWRKKLAEDFEAYQAQKDPNILRWISNEDVRIFDLINSHLSQDNLPSLISFDNSYDLKGTLSEELGRLGYIQKEKKTHLLKLQELRKNGSYPFLTVSKEEAFTLHERKDGLIRVRIKYAIENFGSQPAIEVSIKVFEGNEPTEKFLSESRSMAMAKPNWETFNSKNIDERTLKSMWPRQQYMEYHQILEYEPREESITRSYIFEISYKTKFGESLSDISLVKVIFNGKTKEVSSALIEFKARSYNSEWMHLFSSELA